MSEKDWTSSGMFDPEGARQARRNLAVAREYGEWVGAFDWDRILTVAFPPGVNVRAAERRFRRGIRALESYSGARVDFAASVEIGPLGGYAHVHALLAGGTASLSDREIEYPWHSCRTHSGTYTPRGGWSHYMTKMCASGASELLWSRPAVTRRR